MAVFFQSVKIPAERKTVFFHPAASLELTFGEDHTDILNGMFRTPHIRYCRYICRFANGLEIDLVYHTLDVRQTDLIGIMNMLSAIDAVNFLAEFGRDQSLAVKELDGNILLFLHPFIFANIAFTGSIFNGNDINIPVNGGGVFYDNDSVFLPQQQFQFHTSLKHI